MKKVCLILLTAIVSLGFLGITACSGNDNAGSATFAFDASVLEQLRSDVLRSARAGEILGAETGALLDETDTDSYDDEVESITAEIVVSLAGDYTAKKSIDVSKYVEQLQDDNASKNTPSNIEETITFDGIPVGSRVYATADVYATVTYTEEYRATLKDTLAYFESLNSTDEKVVRWISYAKGIVENGTSTEHAYTGTSEAVTIESGDNPIEISLVEVEEDYPEEPEIKTEQTYIVEYWLQKADATGTSDDDYERDETRTIPDTTADFSENLEDLLTANTIAIDGYTYAGFETSHDSENDVYYLRLYYDKEKVEPTKEVVLTATGTATYPYGYEQITIPFTLYAYGDGTYTIRCDGYPFFIAAGTVVSEGTYKETDKNTIIITEATYTNLLTKETKTVTNPSAKEITMQNGTFTVDSGTGISITFTVEGYESEETDAVSTDITITTPTYATGSITIKATSTTTETGEEINTYTATSGYTTYVWFVDGKPVSASDEGVTVSENTLSLVKGSGVQTIMVVADSSDSATMTVNE